MHAVQPAELLRLVEEGNGAGKIRALEAVSAELEQRRDLPLHIR